MRICACGGSIEVAELTSGKVWMYCSCCKRYEVFENRVLTNSEYGYNSVTDNRKASDDSSLSRGAL